MKRLGPQKFHQPEPRPDHHATTAQAGMLLAGPSAVERSRFPRPVNSWVEYPRLLFDCQRQGGYEDRGFATSVNQREFTARLTVVIRIHSFREGSPKLGTRPKLLKEFGAYLATVETGGELGSGADFAGCFSPRQAPRDLSCARLRLHCSSASWAETRRRFGGADMGRA